ncbi:MAG: hypothetical protein V4628_05400 [Pseudomonadota bacterium]
MKLKQHKSAVALLAAPLLLATPLFAGAQEVVKTAWGEPDISGAYSEFTLAPLERAQELGNKEFFTVEEAEAFAAQRSQETTTEDETEPGTEADVHYSMDTFKLSANEGITSPNLRTSIVTMPANGRIPALVPAAIARRDARAAARKGHEFDGPENRSLTERCVVWSSTLPPILPGGYNSNLQIFQSPGYVIIQGEMGDPRIIPTDGGDLSTDLLPQWNGTSIGRWEGNTLVVETKGFHKDTAWRNASENMHVTEWLTRLDDDTVEYRFEVEDKDTWAEPWGGVYPLTDLDGLLFEYACTEGNYGMANILSGQRAAEQAPAKE